MDSDIQVYKDYKDKIKILEKALTIALSHDLFMNNIKINKIENVDIPTTDSQFIIRKIRYLTIDFVEYINNNK